MKLNAYFYLRGELGETKRIVKGSRDSPGNTKNTIMLVNSQKTLPGGRHHLLLQAWQTAGLPQQALNTQEKEEKR